MVNESICVLPEVFTCTDHFAISLSKLSVLAPVTVMVFSTVLNPLTRTVEAPINPPRDKTAIAKTSGGVRRITLRESLGSDLRYLIIFIVYWYVCRNFLTAKPKENYFKNPDLKSFSSIWPLRETSNLDVPILESVTNSAK